jgi:hypothetical protein
MSEIIFRSPCPAAECNGDTPYKWYHSTCSPSSDEYLNDEAKIRCSQCGNKWDFFNTRFECTKNNNEKKESSLKRAIYCFTALMMTNNLSVDFHKKICDSLKKQAKEYGVA